MEVLVPILFALLLLCLFPLLLWKRRQDARDPQPQPTQVPQVETVVHLSGTRRMRRRPVGSTSTAVVAPEELSAESDEEVPAGDHYTTKASKKKKKKQQERDAQRQDDEPAREVRQTKHDRYAEMRRRKDEERETEERLREEEARARKEKEEAAASLEFKKWKGEFSVEVEGTEENEMQDGSQGLLFDFVEYIKKHKCVPLEELAAEFKLRTQDCINRITSLEKMGKLSGVMDDRGKYIYISPEEMKAVADYLKRQGRVSISHLGSQSNQFIDLEPKVDPIETVLVPANGTIIECF
ncbi:DDRGK domain-containing protein 1 [Amborella trichopoda]|uniref:DDRGK domain-containing protein 1 n=1 Tax=Amborella trichopoda TaxID=13333 RepID=UPI0005D38B24|nr:DDRGK domain-containing protein 1 [Amborella trichopoda]|eukprot:XP_011628901.1 DDRGK domain-containing protein 1 [Amborella trichopoda]